MPKHATGTSFQQTHGGWTKHRGTYQSWQDMKSRCYNPRAQQYKNYGARGITVCDEWIKSFPRFLADMGERPTGLTLDRKDTNGNYCPENCRWATQAEQNRNQRRCVYLEYNGKRMTIAEWSEEIGRHRTTIRDRIKSGYPLAIVLDPRAFERGKVPALAARGTE